MLKENFIQQMFLNKDLENKQQTEDMHLADPTLSVPLHYEELKVQSDLAPIDSHLESIKSPFGL